MAIAIIRRRIKGDWTNDRSEMREIVKGPRAVYNIQK